MCNPISAVLTKERVFFGDTDSHEAIIGQHKLHEGTGPLPNILRVEIRPLGGDFSAPLDQWVYKLDQDRLPVWADAGEDERRARGALGRSGIAAAWAQYEAVRRPAWAQYEAVRRPAWVWYEAVRRPALAQYQAVVQPAWAQYRAVEQPAWAQYAAARHEIASSPW